MLPLGKSEEAEILNFLVKINEIWTQLQFRVTSPIVMAYNHNKGRSDYKYILFSGGGTVS